MPAFSDVLRASRSITASQARRSASRARRWCRPSRDRARARRPRPALDDAPLRSGARGSSRRASTAGSAASAARRSSRTRPPRAPAARLACERRQPEPDLQALYMATLTLTRMAEGGIYDQLGGGFCRYSVDAYWMIPHFEKMLYDNGAAARRVRAGRARDRRRAVPARRAARPPTGCCATCSGAGRRLLLDARCRFRGPRRPLLRLGARRGREAAAGRPSTRCSRRASASTASRTSRGRLAPARVPAVEQIADEPGPAAGGSATRRIDAARAGCCVRATAASGRRATRRC